MPPTFCARRNTSHVLLACGALLSACGGASEEATPARNTPATEAHGASLAQLGATGIADGYDLLLVTLDTVRADHLGCAGYASAQTPTIDNLAAHGVRFEQAIAPAPITLPSHSTLLTGLDVLEHGVRNNGTFALDDSHETLAESLRDQGYRTAAFIGAYVLDARFGLDQGFAHYDDAVNPNNIGRTSGHYNERSAAQVTNAAIAWLGKDLDAAGEQPRFTWVHYFDAHAPYEPPGEFRQRFARKPYDGELAFIDSQLARLLEFLEERGRLARTLVVLTADHGEGLGEHGEDTHSRLLYDSTLRVPLIVSNSTLFDEGYVVRDRVVSLADVYPTSLDLLGLEVRAPVSGAHLFEAEPNAERAIYVETLVPLLNHGWAPLHGLRRLDDKFISAPRAEYYDVRQDPGELQNLMSQGGDDLQALRSSLARRLDGSASAAQLAASEQTLDPQAAARLAALGYTRGASGGALGQKDPKDMMPLWKAMNEARALSDGGQHEAGLRKNAEVLKQEPDDAYANDTAALIYARMGRHVEAERHLQRSLLRAPNAEGYVRLAQLQLARQGLAEMQDALRRASKLDPLEGGVFMVSGDALAMQGRWSEALAAFERALAVDPVKWGKDARAKIQQVQAQGR